MFTREWQSHLDANRKGLSVDGDTFLEPIPGMLNAIGLNATLVTSDGFLLLAGGSLHVSRQRNGWYSSINEGMLPTDKHGGRHDPHFGLARGAEEELGIPNIPLDSITLHTAMYDVRRYQLGLLGHIKLREVPDVEGQIVYGRLNLVMTAIHEFGPRAEYLIDFLNE